MKDLPSGISAWQEQFEIPQENWSKILDYHSSPQWKANYKPFSFPYYIDLCT